MSESADKLLKNEYRSRLNRTIDYIQNHYDEDLNLTKLAEVACFSKFHFHGIFRAMVGETLGNRALSPICRPLFASGTNALATDMVAANVMGFETNEIDTFKWAFKAGMTPNKIDDIQIMGEHPEDVRRQFKKPEMIPYNLMQDWYGPPC
ncbi:MAG: hypothetical protein ACLPSL_07355 [Smithella sp.]